MVTTTGEPNRLTSRVPTIASTPPGTTGDHPRQWIGPMARPTAIPIGNALPANAAVAIGNPAASSRATAHTTKQNSTPTASTTRSHPSATATATDLVDAPATSAA